MKDKSKSIEKPDYRSYKPAGGTRDFLPAVMRQRKYVIDVIREVYESFGFEPLETPALENLSTLLGEYGEDEKLIFKILKRGEKLERAGRDELADLALRYDLTVPLARVVVGNRNDLPRFFKRYQIQPVWRAESHRHGRFAEFYQCDIDVIGSNSLTVEAEMCQAVMEVIHRLGFKSSAIRLNHRKVLNEFLNNAGVPEEKRKSALVVIDKLDKIGLGGVGKEFRARGLSDESSEKLLVILEKVTSILEGEGNNNQVILDYLTEAVGAEMLADLKTIIDLAPEVPFVLDPSLARGLGYYTGAIVEVDLGKEIGSAGGGGRYDDLTQKFSKEQIPACGISLGLERILWLMENREMFPPEIAAANSADVMVTIWNEESVAGSLALAQKLRAQGLRVLLYPEADKIGKQLKYADTIKVPFVCILGEEEAKEGKVKLKNMQTGAEEKTTIEEIASLIKR